VLRNRKILNKFSTFFVEGVMKEHKHLYKIISFIFLSVFIIGGCSASTKTTEDVNPLTGLKNRIHERFSDSLFEHAHWGVMIKSLRTGEIWYERNSNKMFMPASNEKIPTAAASLIYLGPEFKFETKLTYDGEIKDSILKGDLIVFGDGDPTLYNRFFNDPRDVFFKWAEDLNSLGIKLIEGNIIGDDNAFDDNHLGYGWTLDGLDVWYSAEVGALQLNENNVDLKIIPPADKNGTVIIQPNLQSSYFTIINELVVMDSGDNSVGVSRDFGTNKIVVSGKVAAGSDPFERTPSITNPTLFYVTVLREVLQQQGIFVKGSAIDCDDIENWNQKASDFNLLAVHHSPPLKDILTGLMKRSQNMYAETMVRVLGYKASGLGSFREGARVVAEILDDEFGIKPGTYAFRDGSGLTRYNYVSPTQLVAIMEGMSKHEYAGIWKSLQPIAGVDGTLRNRMKNTMAAGNVKAKTGTISNVRGLSGYVTTADGEELVFSFLVNGHLLSSRDTENVTDDVLAWIASFDRSPIVME
jgi:serine-type D-Ala-D-Ala carboxypeptidase/endopeptidase (penicillin-binding protein 4)